jgi:hypothetical protein
MDIRFIGATAFALAVLAAVPARADLIQGEYLFPNLGTVFENGGTQSSASPGFSFSFLGGEVTLAESHHNTDTLTVNLDTVFTTSAFNGPEIIDLSGPNILNIQLDPSSTLVGFNSSDVTFDSSHYWLNLEGLSASAGQTVVVDVTLVGATAVPEPSTLALFGAGLFGLGTLRRRWKAKA